MHGETLISNGFSIDFRGQGTGGPSAARIINYPPPDFLMEQNAVHFFIFYVFLVLSEDGMILNVS